MRNTEVLEKAAEACRGALEVRTREETPLLWAIARGPYPKGVPKMS